MNYLAMEHIQKIVDAHHNRVDIPKHAHQVTLDEIERNEYNINTPRYVTTVDEEPQVDLDEVTRLLDADEVEIAATTDNVDAALKALGTEEC